LTKTRLEAFSDGLFAILITILVLELKVPRGGEWAQLRPLAPVFLTYVLSFIYVGIYWNNHHHLIHMAKRVNGQILWANLHLLFWLSLVPFATGWAGESHFEAAPTALYGLVLFGSGFAFALLQGRIIADQRAQGGPSALQVAVGADLKGKASILAYLAAIGLSFAFPWASAAIYAGVALLWLVPDRRIERGLAAE
jgi:uncharacterized membrane protein